MKEKDDLEHPDTNGRIILRWIFMKWNVGAGTNWLRIGTGGGHM